ncbi:hypothetical protein G6F46_007285 [Rhizopus delemar]|uniref:Ribosome biogenesis protein YTM1 n=2 Tax=Rhizopus TaxID=4842 RepID=A0A9P6Z928_9FUNG|nr:hypothetical protein G6F55_002317 [Rhizopus delemar]KAG1550870.1 hypothetical protein G6F51_002196 [Rhizopus arrhizus]KAG1501602.1 hypothetical protein G6F54_002926 [Rhizopus delemar]KAG1515189.1 hypothetical protein G6F53_003105 [Rhizopus delemar]KAG1525577.1 hypothetical protein G6F52_003200 [Rhizopus delemar]
MSEQVQVRFVTQTPYKVSDATILLPSSIKKEGLSEIVNGLLDIEKPIPFDFLIDGQLLRTSISEYLNATNLSTENLVTIEYVESMLPPVPLTAYQHDDWISSVTGKSGLFATGSYDNMVRLWNTSGECISTFIGHTDSVKSVSLGQVDGDKAIVFSGSLDHSVLAWEYSLENSSYRLMYECKGHKGPVESVAVDANNNYLASASADGLVRVWTTLEPTEDEHLEDEQPSKKKKKAGESRKIKARSVALEGHVGAVNTVAFNNNDSNIVYTGGWDHSIRAWDVEQQVNLSTKNCEKVVLDVDYSLHSKLLATGHTDNTVRLWDPKSEDGTNVKLTLRGHSAWVSSVSWSKKSEYTLCSGSYDSSVRVWDIRSSKEPLYTVDAAENKEKILSVFWDNDKILCGGEEKKMRIYQAKV